jgi:hypothetical protein
VSPDAATAHCFATCIPGTGRIVRGDQERIEGVRVTELGFDGRAEVIRFEATPCGREPVLRLRTDLDIFAEDVATAEAAGRPRPLNPPDASVDAAVARSIECEPHRAVVASGGRVALLASDVPAADVPASEPIPAPHSPLWTSERTEPRAARMEL